MSEQLNYSSGFKEGILITYFSILIHGYVVFDYSDKNVSL